MRYQSLECIMKRHPAATDNIHLISISKVNVSVLYLI